MTHRLCKTLGVLAIVAFFCPFVTPEDKSDLEVRLKPLDEFRGLVERGGKFLMIPAEEISDKAEGKPVHLNATHPSIDRMWDIANTIRILNLNAAPLMGVATDDSFAERR